MVLANPTKHVDDNAAHYHTKHCISTSMHMRRVGQNRVYAPCNTVYLVISLPKVPYIHRI